MNRQKELRFTIPDFEESCHLYDGPEFEGESERAEAALGANVESGFWNG